MTALMGGEDAPEQAEGTDEVTAAIESLAVTSNEKATEEASEAVADEVAKK